MTIIDSIIRTVTGDDESMFTRTTPLSREEVRECMKQYADWIIGQVLYTDTDEYEYLNIYNNRLTVYQDDIDKLVQTAEIK